MEKVVEKIKKSLKKSETFVRLFNSFRLLAWRVKKPKIVAVNMELSSACNQECIFCPVGNRKVPAGFMDFATHKKIIDLLPKSIKCIAYSLRGEPTLNPDFAKMIRYASDKGFATNMSTNGMLVGRYVDELVQSGLDVLNFSVDGATQEVHEKYRKGSNLKKIKEGIKRLAKAREKSPLKYPKEITIQTVVSRHNEEQISDLIEMAESLGVDGIKFKTIDVRFGGEYVRGKEFPESFLPKNKNYWRKQSKLPCSTQIGNVILHNGDISICCVDYGARCLLGNIIKENSFEKAVYNEKYNQLIKRILKKDLPICQNCSLGGGLFITELCRPFVNNRNRME